MAKYLMQIIGILKNMGHVNEVIEAIVVARLLLVAPGVASGNTAAPRDSRVILLLLAWCEVFLCRRFHYTKAPKASSCSHPRLLLLPSSRCLSRIQPMPGSSIS